MHPTALIAGRYRLQELIGTGAMGQVWRGRDERLQRDVAIKVVDLSQAAGAITRDRFQREVIATARLNHPNIVTTFDGGVDGDVAYLVMELLRGESLAARLQRGPLAIPDAVRIGSDVARALASTHAIGVVHRDIKPANVMTGPPTKVLDFGIAQLAGDTAAEATGLDVIGTAAYMSPEQASGRHAGPASDLYSLGCLLVAMLAGRGPFVGATSAEVAHQQVNLAPPRLRDLRPDAPPALDRLVSTLLAKDPAQRPDALDAVAQLATIAGAPALDQDALATATLAGPVPVTVPAGATAVLPPVTSVMPPATTVMPAALLMPPHPDTLAPQASPAPATSDAWFRRGVKGILIAMLGFVVVGALWFGGQQLFAAFTAFAPKASPSTPTRVPSTPSARPTVAPPTIALPTIGLPTIGLPSFDAGQAALRGALGAVDTVLDSWSPSDMAGMTARQQLRQSWTKTSTAILEDDNGAKRLSSFNDQVGKLHDKGTIPTGTYAALRVALQAVGALV